MEHVVTVPGPGIKEHTYERLTLARSSFECINQRSRLWASPLEEWKEVKCYGESIWMKLLSEYCWQIMKRSRKVMDSECILIIFVPTIFSPVTYLVYNSHTLEITMQSKHSLLHKSHSRDRMVAVIIHNVTFMAVIYM